MTIACGFEKCPFSSNREKVISSYWGIRLSAKWQIFNGSHYKV